MVTPRLDLGCTDAVHYWCDAWLAGQMAPRPPRAATPLGNDEDGSASSSDEAAKTGPPPLHVLVNNAGANFMGVEPWYTKHGVAGLPQVRRHQWFHVEVILDLKPACVAGRTTCAWPRQAQADGNGAAREGGREVRSLRVCVSVPRRSTLWAPTR